MDSQEAIRVSLIGCSTISEKSLSINGANYVDTKVIPIPPSLLETMGWPNDLVLRLVHADHTDRKNGDYHTYVGILSRLNKQLGVRDISNRFCLEVKIVANRGESSWAKFGGNFNCRPFEDFDEVGPIGWDGFTLLMFWKAIDRE
ncbi:MAG: hypothetical protein AAB415_02145 [Patescibacteria group bacterium]